MSYRKVPLAAPQVYHIFTKSIAGFKVFNTDKDFTRMIETMVFYTLEKPPCKFSLFSAGKEKGNNTFPSLNFSKRIVKITAYCLMPTHIHLILQQLKDNGISRYVNLILKSYTKHFNIKHKRHGPLWEGRFKNILAETDEQLLHLTRYVHLNPVTAYLVNKPEKWRASSYREYLLEGNDKEKICDYHEILDIKPASYKKFVEDRVSYQRELAKIKHLIIE